MSEHSPFWIDIEKAKRTEKFCEEFNKKNKRLKTSEVCQICKSEIDTEGNYAEIYYFLPLVHGKYLDIRIALHKSCIEKEVKPKLVFK